MRRNGESRGPDGVASERRESRARMRALDLLDYFTALAGIENRRARRDIIRALRLRALHAVERAGGKP